MKEFLFRLSYAFVHALFIIAWIAIPIGFFIGVMMFGDYFGLIPVFVLLFVLMVVGVYFNIRDCDIDKYRE